MASWIADPWGYGEGHHFADTCQESDKPTHSKLLGPDGKPLAYKKERIGFDLTPKQKDR